MFVLFWLDLTQHLPLKVYFCGVFSATSELSLSVCVLSSLKQHFVCGWDMADSCSQLKWRLPLETGAEPWQFQYSRAASGFLFYFGSSSPNIFAFARWIIVFLNISGKYVSSTSVSYWEFWLLLGQICVKRRAQISVALNPHCSQDQAIQAVDNVWNTCYKDTRPFDRVP